MRLFYTFLSLLLLFVANESGAQTAYNPYLTTMSFSPAPTPSGFECGSSTTVTFNVGLSTTANATNLSSPLTITVCAIGFQFISTTPSLVVSGTYASKFTWYFDSFAPNCLVGTQNQTLPGASFGSLSFNIMVPPTVAPLTNLAVNANLQVPGYMQQFNVATDDNKSSPPVVSYCSCSPLTNPGSIGGNQSFCGSGDPALFSSLTAPTGGSGGTIMYQWQVWNGTSWIDIAGATNDTYDAPPVSSTTSYRRNTKRSTCTSWASSNVIVVTINTAPVADAGPAQTLTCSQSSATLGTAAIAGNTYLWQPATALSSSSVAQPVANPTTTTTYTVTVTNTGGCTATSSVTVSFNTSPPSANAGAAQSTSCLSPSATIGSASVAGNSYLWSPASGLSSANIAQPIANPVATTIYTLTVTGSNGCTATSNVTVTVNKTPPTANAGVDKTITCSVTSVQIGTAAIAGNTYAWLPVTALSSASVAQPTSTAIATTIYTVTVTGSNGCTATSSMTVIVNKTPPTANSGGNKTNTCSSPTSVIGTAAIAGNTYAWLPTSGLSGATLAQPTANPVATTTYTVTVTGSNACTATSTVLVTVNKTAPTANAGPDRNLTCSSSSAIIGTAAVAGNSYSWLPATALSATNIAQPTANPTSNTTYTVTVTGSNGCTATDAVVVFSSTSSCVTSLAIKAYIESYFQPSGTMVPVLFNQGVSTSTTVCDSMTVELHSMAAPYATVASSKVVLGTNGTGVCTFTPFISGTFYVVLKHRNAIQTWSSVGVTVGSVITTYDFTNAITKAYGDNMIQVQLSPARFALYSGDLNQDENIDVLDLAIMDTDVSNFLYGYESSDLNGDGNVDILDNTAVETNLSNFIYSIHP